jgi:hypothetical protein
MRRVITLLAVVGLVATPLVARADDATPEFVLSPEGNHLWAYDTTTHERQLLIQAVNGAAPAEGTVTAGPGMEHRDINGQICVAPDGHHIITGEDTVVSGSGSSHAGDIAGWGYFTIHGDAIGDIIAHQAGKLAPTSAGGPGYSGDPDNFGCGFLDRERLFTTAIGNTTPPDEANGQLFLWFGPFDTGFRTTTNEAGITYYTGDVEHCVVDPALATAGGIAIDGNDIYVAANRPDDESRPGGVWRYHSDDWPRTKTECESPSFTYTKTLVVPPLAVDGVPLPEPRSLTPSAVVISPNDTLFVSSVFTGTVSEYTKDGAWIRDVYPTGPVAPRTGPTSNTPFGLAVTADGSLWIADLGIVLNDPVDGQGSLIRVRFDAVTGLPTPLGETVHDSLNYPDGLGVYTP